MIKKIEDLNDGDWADIEVEVIEMWDSNHESIRQVGLIGDDTGIMKLVSWEKSNMPLMQEEHKYRLSKVVISVYENRIQGALNSRSTITPIGSEQAELPKV